MIRHFLSTIVRSLKLALPYGKGKLALVALFLLITGVMQIVGVVSIFPFFMVVSKPSIIRDSGIGRFLLGYLDPMNDRELLLVCGLLAIGLLFVSNFFTLLNEVVRNKYAHGLGHWLRCRMINDIASRPYGYFLNANTAILMQKISGDVSNFTIGIMLPITEAATRIVILSLLVFGLGYIHPIISSCLAIVLGMTYLVVYIYIKPKAYKNGQSLQEHSRGMGVTSMQFITGIKPIVIHSKIGYFLRKFSHHSAMIAPLSLRQPLYANGPKYFIEPLLFGAFIAVVIKMIFRGNDINDILPSLTVWAFAGYRILPSAQILYAQITSITTWSYLLPELESELNPLETNRKQQEQKASGALLQKVPFEHAIHLESISFRYGNATKPVLNGFDCEIKRNQSVGIVGTTGSGKSTLVDLILGLHRPQVGRILVDGQELTEELMPAWRSKIGYVPQDIFLLDDTIAANIAFGVSRSEWNMEHMREAASAARILEFVEKELPAGFDSEVGERGVRLSGGQRQRVGLARALYHKPEILILDEATSALDNETEIEVMETIKSLRGTLTMLIIAHRLTTVKDCNVMIRLGKTTEC